MKKKKLSIITICYNEPNLESTCKSIVNQTWQDFEWIVIDGGSNQETLDIFEKYKYRIDKFVSEKDNGIYNACNKGIARATGEYCIFINAGDYFYSDDILEKVFEYKYKEDILYGNECFLKNPVEIRNMPNKVNSEFFIKSTLRHQSTFIKRKLFEKFGYYDENYKIVSDYEKWIVFYKKRASFKHLPLTISCFDVKGISSWSPETKVLHNKERQYVIQKYFSKKLIEKVLHPAQKENKIFSKKISPNGTHNVYTILGLRLKFKKKRKTICKNPVIEKHFQDSQTSKRALVVFHINFLRKHNGCSNYAYEIVRMFKENGYAVDFFTASIFSQKDFNDVEQLNLKDKLIDNFYFINWKDAFSKKIILKIFNIRLIVKKEYYDKDVYYILGIRTFKRKKFQEPTINNWVNKPIKDYFAKVVTRKKYDFVNIHYIQWADLITPEIKNASTYIYSCHDTNFIHVSLRENNHNILTDETKKAFSLEYDGINKFDKVMCISNDEKLFWEKLFPKIDFSFIPHPLISCPLDNNQPTTDILYVASPNEYNKEGLEWFINEVYPKLSFSPQVTICGKLTEMIKNSDSELFEKMLKYNFNIISFAEKIETIYASTRIVINPLLRGAGLKIKTIEAMSYNIPIVSTTEGIAGFPDKNNNGILVSNNSDEFASNITKLLNDSIFYVKIRKEEKEYFDKNLSFNIVSKRFLKVLEGI